MLNSGKHELVPISAIELDTSNPRIANALSAYEKPYTAEQIFLAISSNITDEHTSTGPTFNKLRQSIITNGGVIQPVHLQRQKGGKYLCIEGNTRVALYREFFEGEQEGSWAHIPAIVYGDVSDEELHAIRLQAHLVGPREWDPYSKAKYLHYLRNEKHYDFSRLVDLCGGNERSILESLYAYEDMEKYYRPLLEPGQPFDIRRFSGFVELEKPGIKEALTSSGFTISDFSKWILDRRIGPLADVRWLPRVLKDPKAKAVFLSKGMEEAKKVVDRPDVSKQLQELSLPTLARALTQAIQKIGWSEIKRLREDPTSADVQDILETYDSLKGIMPDLGLKPE
jgi:hypothetical protein